MLPFADLDFCDNVALAPKIPAEFTWAAWEARGQGSKEDFSNYASNWVSIIRDFDMLSFGFCLCPDWTKLREDGTLCSPPGRYWLCEASAFCLASVLPSSLAGQLVGAAGTGISVISDPHSPMCLSMTT